MKKPKLAKAALFQGIISTAIFPFLITFLSSCSTTELIRNHESNCARAGLSSCPEADYYRAWNGDNNAAIRLVRECSFSRNAEACESERHLEAFRPKLVVEARRAFNDQERLRLQQEVARSKAMREREAEEAKIASERKQQEDSCREDLSGKICFDNLLRVMDSTEQDTLENAAYFGRRACARKFENACELLRDVNARLDRLHAGKLSEQQATTQSAEQKKTRDLLIKQERQRRADDEEKERRKAIADAIQKAADGIEAAGKARSEAYKPKKTQTCKSNYIGGLTCTED